MELTILGCDGPFPSADGATSGYWLHHEATDLLLDCGSGVLGMLSSRMHPADLTAVLLSHWHYDHVCDLLPLLYRLEIERRRLTVYAPADESSAIRRLLSAHPMIDLHTIAPGDRLTVGGIGVQVFEARHPVPAIMFRLSADGKTLCYSGDTNTTPDLLPFADHADWLLIDGLFPADQWSEAKPHLSALLAAGVARDAQVKNVIITHLSPLIDPVQLLREIRTVRPDGMLARRGCRIHL